MKDEYEDMYKKKNILRVLFYCPFTIVVILFFIFKRHLHVLVWLFNFPQPTVISPQKIVYSHKNFGTPIYAGFSKRDITPERYTWVAGFMPPHPSLSIKDKIQVKSLAIQDGNGETIVIVSCDLIGLLPDEIEKIFSLVTEIDKRYIFLSTTHTHSGPDTYGLWSIPFFGGKNKKYLSRMRKEIALAIDDSVKNLQKSAIRFGIGEFKGHSVGREENMADPQVAILQVLVATKIASKELVYKPVTLVNFAVHADVVQGLQISVDFPYFLAHRLNRRIGGETIFIPGAIGGVQPEGVSEGDSYFVRSLGENLADKVVEILKNPIILERINISLRRIEVSAPLENSAFRSAAKIGMVSNILNKDNKVTTEVVKINLGSVEILTVPGELFPKIWWRVKPLMKGKPKFIFGLTNGGMGYILLPEDITSGKHEYHTSVSIGAKFGMEVDKALHQLVTSD